MRESSSRNGGSSGSSSSANNNIDRVSLAMSNHPHNNLHAMQHSMMNNNIHHNYDNHASAGDVNMNGSAGISSSGSSRSTARYAAAAAASAFASSALDNNGYSTSFGNNVAMASAGQQGGSGGVGGLAGNNNNNNNGIMMRMMQNQAGLTSTGSGSSQDVVMRNNNNTNNNNSIHHDLNNLYHRQHQQQQQQQQQQNDDNYYSSSAGAPSSQAAASDGYHNHSINKNNTHNNNNTHYSQYSSITYPGELTVYSWGRGEDGQLGIGDTSDQDEPTYVDALRGVGVKQIACGSGHTVVLTGEGEVYTWGRGDDGRLGHGDNGWKYVPRLTHSLTGQIVTHVTCGSYHTAAVSSNGDLYTWGGGMYGKLGHGNESGHSTPRRVEALVGLSVIDIACGSRHTAVVTNKGCLYTCKFG